MQNEGDDIQITLRGIERAKKGIIVEDGAMNEVIGMIVRDGSFVPYSPTDKGLNKANDIKMIRIHHTSTGDNVIVVRQQNGLTGERGLYKIQYADATTYNESGFCHHTITTIQRTTTKKTETTTAATEETTVPVYEEDDYALYTDIQNIIFIGNRMIVETDNGIEYFLWKNGAYTRETGDHNSNNYTLPSVEFKVRAGILGQDGKVHKFAQTVQIENPYAVSGGTPSAGLASPKLEAEYARSTKNMGSDALALLSSIQYNGGITGYVLVTAAYHLKASAGKDNEYIPAAPIVLMGAPTIEQKNGKVVTTESEKKTLPNGNNNAYMIDVLDYTSKFLDNLYLDTDTASEKRNYIGGISSQKACAEALFNAKATGTASEENTKYNTIQYEDNGNLVGSTNTTVRVANKSTSTARGYVYAAGYYTRGDTMWIPASTNRKIQTPALFGCKYGTYYHPNRTGTIDTDAVNKGYRILRGTGNILSIRLNSEIDSKYKDEIDKLVIFMSPIISPFTTDTNGQDIKMVSTMPEKYDTFRGFFFDESSCNGNWMRRRSCCGGGFIPEMKSEETLRNEINNIANLYAVHEIAYSDLKNNVGGWKDIQFKEGELITSHIVEQTALKLSDLYKVDIIKGHIFGYNGRVHIYDYIKSTVQRVKYTGLNYYGSLGVGQYDAGTAGTYHYAVVVTDTNSSKVVSQFDSAYPVINPLLSYPDTGATNIRVIKYYQQGEKYYLGYKDFTPTKFNTAISTYYVNSDLSPINIAVQEVTPREYENAVPEEQIAQDSETYGKNEIRVSGTADLIFKDDKNYKVGNGEIIGLARLTMSLSQDNYGRFPLVVFTTDGIYTLEVDSTGEHAYTEQAPMSRVICTNKNSICELDNAVLFASEYGLMLATSAGVKAFAPQVNGTPNNTPDDKKGLSMYKNAVAHEKIVELTDSISQEDFIEYIQASNTYIRYLHAINSVILYNPSKTYSYLIDLGTIACTKLEQQIRLDDNDFPKQTFYIQPKVQTEIVLYRTTKSGTTSTTEQIYIEDAIAAIDVEALLIAYFTKDILQQLYDMLNTNADLGLENAKELSGLIEWTTYCEGMDEVWFQEYYQKDKATVLQELEDERTRLEEEDGKYEAKDEAIRKARSAFQNESEGADAKIDALGIKSLTTLMKEEAEGKADYTELRETLRQEEIAEQYGVVNTALLDFPIGRTTLFKQEDGTWKYGNSIVPTQRLTDLGLTPATALAAGDYYTIITTNKQYAAVQFDYYTSSDSAQCLLQSRPIKLGNQAMKTTYRVVVRGTFGKTDGFSIESKQHNAFTITDREKLLQYCQAKGTLTFYYKEITTVVKSTIEGGQTTIVRKWKWVDTNDKEVTLKDYGIEQKNAILGKRDTLTISIQQHYAGLYVFGSLDGEHWMPIGGTEKLLSYNRFHDLGCRTHRVSVRYLMVVFAGDLDTDCHIDGVEITNETKYNNKLK